MNPPKPSPPAESPPAPPSAPPSAPPPADDRSVGVLLPLALTRPYHYCVPAGMSLDAGDVVRVPLRRKEVYGVVWDDPAETPAADKKPQRLKTVLEKCPVPPIAAADREFIRWAARYTLAPVGNVLRLMLAVPDALNPETQKACFVAGPPPAPLTDARRRALTAAAATPDSPADLARAARVSPAVVSKLIALGALAVRETRRTDDPPPLPDGDHSKTKFSPEQAAAVAAIKSVIGDESEFHTILLDGVTGSGKTDVYFDAVAHVLERDRQVLILLPEIALTTPFLERFARRFGCPPVAWHSALSPSRRRRNWRAAASGTARVIVGARSALFLPLPRPGLIIVDEEHDAAFKQEDGVLYHARDMAVARGKIANIPVLLSSATPSLESLNNVRRGRYHHVALPKRFGDARLPEIDLLDMRQHPPDPGRWIAPPLLESLRHTLAQGQQAMMFLNRRGYAPLTLCRKCGHRLACRQCDSWMVRHKTRNGDRLLCHHCGAGQNTPPKCPQCDAEDSLAACGPGVERIHEELAECLPDARLMVLSSDTAPSPAAQQEAVKNILERRVDVIIGTQIITKGHHFPDLTLAGVIDADLGLANADLRAAERTHQLLHQVAGRAGREKKAGRAVLQTWMPEHPVMRALASGDRDQFMAQESAAREAAGLPPFGRLVAVIVSGRDEGRVGRVARDLAAARPDRDGVRVFGPAPAPLSRLRGRWRMRLLLQAGVECRVQPVVRRWIDSVAVSADVRVAVDVDPYGFM